MSNTEERLKAGLDRLREIAEQIENLRRDELWFGGRVEALREEIAAQEKDQAERPLAEENSADSAFTPEELNTDLTGRRPRKQRSENEIAFTLMEALLDARPTGLVEMHLRDAYKDRLGTLTDRLSKWRADYCIRCSGGMVRVTPRGVALARAMGLES